jgi:hypothetical protein
LGKYSHLTPHLPKYQDPDISYQEKVNAVKAEILKDNPDILPSDLGRMFNELKTLEEQAEEQLKIIQLRKAAVEQLTVDALEKVGLTQIRLADGPSLTVQVEPYASVKDKAVFRKWVDDNNLSASLSLPWQTLNAIAKERLLAGEPEPDGVTIFAKSKLVTRK